MAELAQAGPLTLTARRKHVVAWLGEDRDWLIVMAAVTAIETTWWAITWSYGIAPPPFLLTYLALAFAGLGFAFLLTKALRLRAPRQNWLSNILGTVLIGVGASMFLPLKYAIPRLVPFWMDSPLANGERAIFTADPWLVLDRLLGWAAIPIDRLYGLWLPIQSLVLFTVILQPASTVKSRTLIAYVLTWFLLGVVAATLFSSAGPLFHDRIFGGAAFAGLPETLRDRGAWVALAESDRMWTSLASGRPGLVSGISAVPSIHVAISVWIALSARTMAPRTLPYALLYVAFIWIGSVQLGWHYVLDGAAGVLGMLAIWMLSAVLQRQSYFGRQRPLSTQSRH